MGPMAYAVGGNNVAVAAGTASSYLQRSDWNLHNRFVRKNLIDLPNKNAAVPVVLILAAGVACPQDVKHLLRTIDNLTQKESLRNGIETELRAAFILRDSYPAESAALLKRGKARLAAHLEVVP